MKTTRLKDRANLAWLLAATCSLSACGQNMLESSEPDDAAEDAVLALEDDDPDSAIDILEEALSSDEDNPQYLSILAMAYAQRAGVDPLLIAQRMAEGEGSEAEDSEDAGAGATSDNGITELFDVMPDATDENLADIDYAVSLILGIPTADRLSGDSFKLAIYQTSSMVMHTKALDSNGDGTLSPEELMSLSTSDATVLINQIATAQATLAADESNEANTSAAESLAEVQAAIDASPGDTDAEKLQNFLASRDQ